MKRIITIIALFFYSIAANAQTNYLFQGDREMTLEFMRSTVATIVLFIITAFILSLVRVILTDRLKRKMLEKGVPGEVVASMLPRKNEQIIAMKWFSILIAISVGLLIISFFPRGIYSIVIMTFCVALGFLGFYLWTKRLNN